MYVWWDLRLRTYPRHRLSHGYRQVPKTGKLKLIVLFLSIVNFCRVTQVDPEFAPSLGAGFARIRAEEGLKGFTLVSTLPSS